MDDISIVPLRRSMRYCGASTSAGSSVTKPSFGRRKGKTTQKGRTKKIPRTFARGDSFAASCVTDRDRRPKATGRNLKHLAACCVLQLLQRACLDAHASRLGREP